MADQSAEKPTPKPESYLLRQELAQARSELAFAHKAVAQWHAYDGCYGCREGEKHNRRAATAAETEAHEIDGVSGGDQ